MSISFVINGVALDGLIRVERVGESWLAYFSCDPGDFASDSTPEMAAGRLAIRLGVAAISPASAPTLPPPGSIGPFPVEPSGPRWVAVAGGGATCPNGKPHNPRSHEVLVCWRCDAQLRWETGP